MVNDDGGKLLSHSVPVTVLDVVPGGGGWVVGGSGPSLLLANSVTNTLHTYQLFPNERSITGLSIKEEDTEEEEGLCTVVVYAGNSLCVVKIVESSEGIKLNEDQVWPRNTTSVITLPFIPVASRWVPEGGGLALLSIMNVLVLHDKDGKEEMERWEGIKEVLYSGLILDEGDKSFVVFSGTTFSGIVVWKVSPGGVTSILHKLKGHKGIPFSLAFNYKRNLLLSTSDDRTVIAWKFGQDEGEDKEMEHPDKGLCQLLSSEVSIIHKWEAHETRVWKAIWVELGQGQDLLMVSVGEDSLIQVASLEGSMKKCWRGHEGAPIYSVAYSPANHALVTGSHDGAIHCWKGFAADTDPHHVTFDKIPVHPWTEHLVSRDQNQRSSSNEDFPRNICSWGCQYIIGTTDKGRLFAYSVKDKLQRDFFYDSSLRRYGILTVSPENQFLAVGAVKGEFFLFLTYLRDVKLRVDLCQFSAEKIIYHKFPSKILHIHWIASEGKGRLCLIVTLDNKAYLFRFCYCGQDEKTGKHLASSHLLSIFAFEEERPGIPSALLTSKNHLLLGDEVSSIFLYPNISINEDGITVPGEFVPEEKDYIKPVDELKHIHKEGVTSIVEYKGRILSSGRYGGIKTLEIVDNGRKLVKLQEFLPPFEWVARMTPILHGKELLVGGIHKGKMLLYSWEQKRVVEQIENMGGGHRRWDLRCDGGENKSVAVLTFLKDHEIYFASVYIPICLDIVIKPGLHTRTTNCATLISHSHPFWHFGTGSEDGSLRVIEYNYLTNRFKPLLEITSHASSIRALLSIQLDESHALLISAGGRSEVRATFVGFTSSSPECQSVGKFVVIPTSKNRKEADVDTRIMDVCLLEDKDIIVATACSDGSIRLLSFSLENKKFIILAVLRGNSHCVMKVRTVNLNNDTHIIIGVTSNGFLLVWKFSADLQVTEIETLFSHPLLQCSVMSLNVSKSSESDHKWLMAIGGDDCSLSLWTLELSLAKIEISQRWMNTGEQRGALVGIVNVAKDKVLYTCANDQVLGSWDLDTGSLLQWKYAGVTDCQGFLCSPTKEEGETILMCFGNGMSWIAPPSSS